MLRHTFCHVPSIGLKRERSLWACGLRSWGDLAGLQPGLISPGLLTALRAHIPVSLERLNSGDLAYFGERIPSDQTWRLFTELRPAVAFVDIETTGLTPRYDQVTTISIYDGNSVRYYVAGIDIEQFQHDIAVYRLIVTYNGKCFDVPFPRESLGIYLNQCHIDLRYVLGSLGYRGGLKACEVRLGIDRGALSDVDGYFAVLLWQEYQNTGNQAALDTLLAYNIEDVVNLEKLMVLAYNEKLKATPFENELRLPEPPEPYRPLQPDLALVSRIQSRSMR